MGKGCDLYRSDHAKTLLDISDSDMESGYSLF